MGKIACANVLSDIYATGVTRIDNMLMILSACKNMRDKEREFVCLLLIEGFKECASEAGTCIRGGHTGSNPWVIVGGVATAICSPDEFIEPYNAKVGDVIVLTKPLGTQVAVNAHQWIHIPDRFKRIKDVISIPQIKKAYQRAINSMTRLNKTAAALMKKYGAHAATDITGFGILGHAQNLASFQKHSVCFSIHSLPIIKDMRTVELACGERFGLLKGRSAETSGGLFIILPRQSAMNFCKEIESIEKRRAYIIGVVENSEERTAKILEHPNIIEVPDDDNETMI